VEIRRAGEKNLTGGNTARAFTVAPPYRPTNALQSGAGAWQLL